VAVPIRARRWGLSLTLSLLAHLGMVAAALVVGAGDLGGPVEVELADVRIEEVKELPLSGAKAGQGEKSRPKARSRAAPAPETGTLQTTPGDESPKAGGPDGDGGPAPTSDLGAYGPEGSRFTALIRLDRLRGTDYAGPVDELLMRLPDRRDLLEGTGLDLFADFDALLAATPNPRDPAVTFLAVRHHLESSNLRTALTRGARASGHNLVWRDVGGRPVGERRARPGKPSGRDGRLIILAAKGLAVVTPPAYRALLLGTTKTREGTNADGGAGASDDSPDGGDPARAAAGTDWASLLSRIDAEEGLMPPDAAVMLHALDIFKPAGTAPGHQPVLWGMAVPPAINGVIGIADNPYLDVVAGFKEEQPARHWEAQWPVLQRRLRTHPIALLSGLSGLISRASVTREGPMVRLHLSVSRDEALRLLTFALSLLSSRYGDLPVDR
jgi:hypothetical protein